MALDDGLIPLAMLARPYKAMRVDFKGERISPLNVEPKADWQGRECVALAPGVIRFTDEKSPIYHLIPERFLIAI